MLVRLAAARLTGAGFPVGLDRHRADTAGQALTSVAGLASTTAAGLAWRFTDGQWCGVETGLGEVHNAALQALAAVAPDPGSRADRGRDVDLDITDVEVLRPARGRPDTWGTAGPQRYAGHRPPTSTCMQHADEFRRYSRIRVGSGGARSQ